MVFEDFIGATYVEEQEIINTLRNECQQYNYMYTQLTVSLLGPGKFI